jgi:hypothetical protein
VSSWAECSKVWTPIAREFWGYFLSRGYDAFKLTSNSSATKSASSVDETDIQTPSKYDHESGPLSIVNGQKQTCCTHCTPRKRHVQEMIQGVASPDRLLSH